MHGDNLTGFHIQKICQHPVAEIGCSNRQKGHGAIQTAHLKSAVSFERKGGRGNEVLYGKPGFHQPLPVKEKLIVVPHVEHSVHQAQPLFTIHRSCNDTQATEIIEKVIFNMSQSRFCLTHGLCLDTEGQIFCFGQAIISLSKLLLQHLAVLRTNRIELILFEWDTDTFFKALRISTHVHKGQLKVNGTVKEIQEAAPFIENGSFVLLLCQLVVDVLELNGFGVITVCHTTNPIREHSLKRDRLLGSLRNTIILFCSFDNSFNFSLLFPIEMGRHFYFSCRVFLLEKQCVLPPFRVGTDEAVRHSSCRSDMVGFWGEQTSPE